MSEPAFQTGPLAAVVIRNVRRLRDARRWTAEEMTTRTARAGYALPRHVIANMENGRRRGVSVDELAVLAAVLQVDPWSLTTDDPVCVACRNNAPAGFSCMTCGRAGHADAVAVPS